MSPYFTSSTPVYARNWANGQNLVDSTKIERLQVVSSNKVQRKEKKEKKKDKKLKNEKPSLKLKCIQTKKVVDESEQLERSCVTDEVEQQQCVGYLSDGSQNSKKRRRRENSPAVESQIKATPVAGKPLRIRFVFKKPKEAEVLPQEEDRVCSTSGSEQPIKLSSSVSGVKPCDQFENLLSTSHESNKTVIIPSESKKSKKHRPSKESRYNTLFDELVPPCISSLAGLREDDSNSGDWLFGSSRQRKATTPKSSDEDMTMSLQRSEDSSVPRAQFLPEVGIFSLPYTVLF